MAFYSVRGADPLTDALEQRAVEAQKPKPKPKSVGPSPKPQEWYSNLGEATVQTLAQALGEFLAPASTYTDVANKLPSANNAISRAIGEGPVGMALRAGDAARQQLAQVEQQMTQQILASGGNPDPSMRVQGNVPLRAPLSAAGAAVNPMLAALGGMAPESAPVDFSVSRSQAAHGAGAIGREAIMWEAGAGATRALPAVQKFASAQNMKNLPQAMEQFGSIKAAQEFVNAQKFNAAKVLEDTVGGFTTGVLESFNQDYANPDGTYTPAETLKKAAAMSVMYGLGGGVLQSLGQVAKTLKSDIISKALSREDKALVAAGKARKPTTDPYALGADSKELGVDQLSGLRIEGPQNLDIVKVPGSPIRTPQYMARKDAEALLQDIDYSLRNGPEGMPMEEYYMLLDDQKALSRILEIPDQRGVTLGSGLGGGQGAFRRRGQKGPATSPYGADPISDPTSGSRAEKLMREGTDPAAFGKRVLSDLERGTLVESLGRDKGTRFGKRVFELSDEELLKVASDARAAATLKAATKDTVREQKPLLPTPDAAEKRRAGNIKMIQNYGKSLTIDDVAALSKTSVERVAGADPKKLSAWLKTNAEKLKLQGVKNFNTNRTLKPRNFATGAEHTAVAQVLKKHGFLPEDVALALNAGFEPPASGIPSLDPIDVAKAVKPGDVYRFDPKALDTDITSGAIGRKIRYLKAVAADMKTLPPEVQQLYPATPEGAVQFLNHQRQGKFPGVSADAAEEMMQRKLHGDKVQFDEYAEGQNPFEQTHAESATQIGDALVAPEKLYTVKYQGADGQEAIANMYGDQIIEANAAGHLEKPTIKEVPSADPEHDAAIGTFLGSGFGGAQPLYEKYIEKRLAKYGPEVAAQWGDFKNNSTPEGLLRFAIAFEMPTAIAHREPAVWKAVDTAAAAEGMVMGAEKKFLALTRKNKDLTRLLARHPKEAQALADKLVEWNWQYKQTYRSVEQAKRDADLAGIMQTLDPQGQKMFMTVYEQINSIRSSAQQELVGGLKEAARFSKRPVEMQKRFTDVIDRKINANPDYVHFNRKGNYSVNVSRPGESGHMTTVHKENWETLAEAQKGLKDLKTKYGTGHTYAFEDRASNLKEVHGNSGVKKSEMKARATARDEDAILEMLDVDRIVPAEVGTDMESVLQGLAEETVIGKTPTYLGKRQYIPGHKVTLETVFSDFERLHGIGSKLRAASMVRNTKPDVLEYVRNGLLTKNPKKQRILLDYVDQYLGMAEKPMTEKTGFGMLRAGLANLQLGMKAQFPVVNMTGTLAMSANIASGYGTRGLARWAAGHKIAQAYALQRLWPKSKSMEQFLAQKLPPEIVKNLKRLSDEGHLGSAIIEELTSLTHTQAGSMNKTLQKYLGKGVGNLAHKTVSAANKAATLGILATERYLRFVDGMSFLGIGYDLGHRGDDLFNFAYQRITEANLRQSDMWLPQAIRGSGALKESVKTAKMFWRFPVAQYIEMKNAIRDSLAPVTKESAQRHLRAYPSKRSALRTIHGRAAIGKSRLRLPVAAMGQLALGGSMAFDPTVLASLGVASVAGVGVAAATEAAMRAWNAHIPNTDKILKELEGPDPESETTNMTWDERTRYWEDQLNIPETFKGTVHYGAPALAGVNVGRSTSVSTPLQVGMSPLYPSGVINDLLKSLAAYKKTGDGTQLLRVASAGKGINEASEMARTGRISIAHGDEKTALEDSTGEPYEPETLDYVAALGRFETVKVADLRNKTANALALTRRQDQLRNAVTKDVKAYIEQNGEDADWGIIQEKLEPLIAWNDLALSKGLAQKDSSLLMDLKSIQDTFTDRYEEVLFAEGKPRTATQRVQIAQSRSRKPSTKDILTSEEGDE